MTSDRPDEVLRTIRTNSTRNVAADRLGRRLMNAPSDGIDVARRHRFYEKIVRTSSTLYAHDEANDAHIGDTVVVRECRPLSRTKHWRLVQVLERAE